MKRVLTVMLMMSSVSIGYANDTCKILPGSVVCSKGVINSINGNGMVTINGTTILNATIVNGLLSATDANFNSLIINGTANLTQCTVNEMSEIKGSLSASSTKFEKGLTVFSNSTRFINSKVSGDLHVGHCEPQKQVVYLDNFSEVTGDIIFDDGHGVVFTRGKSKIGGKITGGLLQE